MLANFFGKSKPINFIIIIGLFFSYFSVASFVGIAIDDFSIDFLLKKVGIFLIFLFIFFFFNFIISKNNLTFDNSYAFLFFVLFLSFFIKELLEYKMLFLFLINLLFLRKVYSLQSSKTIYQKLFDGGFWLGILFIYEPFSIVYLILFYAAIYIHKKLTIRTLIIPIFGFIIPLIIYFSYSFWYDKSEDFQQLFFLFTNYNLSIYSQKLFLIPLLLISFYTITSLFLKTPNALSVKNSFRRSWVLVIFNLFIAIIFVVILTERNGSEIIFLLFPVAIIVANGLEMITKKILKNAIIISLLICSFLIPIIL